MIPFQIPAEFQHLLTAGKVQRFGAILKDVQTGQIVGHIQETGLLSDILSKTLSLDPTGITGVVQVAQNVQMSSKLNAITETLGAMQGIQMASLATSVVGIGVHGRDYLERLQHETDAPVLILPHTGET